MAAPSYVTSTTDTFDGTTTAASTVLNTSVGDLVSVEICQTSAAGGRTYGVADDKSNTWLSSTKYVGGTNRIVQTFWTFVASGKDGDLAVTVTASGNVNGTAIFSRASPASGTTIAYDAESSVDNAAGTNHFCAAVGQLDTSADVLVYSMSALNGTILNFVGATGFTTVSQGDDYQCQRIASTSGLTDERAEWSGDNSPSSVGMMISFKSVGGSGPTEGELLAAMPPTNLPQLRRPVVAVPYS